MLSYKYYVGELFTWMFLLFNTLTIPFENYHTISGKT